MAQKMDNDETELKVPENLPICTPPPPIPSPSLQIPPSRSPDASDARSGSSSAPLAAEGDADADDKKKLKRVAMKRPREATRCSGPGCRKKVGLIGFRCRCGDVYCAEHRYSDRHDCTYDYKAAGREAIARENPVVRAAKLLKV